MNSDHLPSEPGAERKGSLTAPTPRPRAALYLRISDDKAGQGLGVDRQETDCRALAERLGWDVVGVYADNDVSAYSGKVRPQYRAMLAAVRAGHVDAILAYAPDRLYRRMPDLVEFTELVTAHSLKVETVNGGKVDLTTPQGVFNANVLGAAAQFEAQNTAWRVRRAREQAAKAGRFTGGARPFGFEPDGVTLRESEALFIREATRAVLAGRSVGAIVKEANAQGIRTSRGSEWRHNTLRQMLLRPRNAGLVASGHPDAHARGGVEIIAPAQWPAIISEDEWRALVDLCSGRRRPDQSTAAKWLGTHIFTCGKPVRDDSTDTPEVCGAWMAVIGRHHGTKHYSKAYTCSDHQHVAIDAYVVDEAVQQVMAHLLRDPRVTAALTAHDAEDYTEDRARRRTLVQSLEQTERDYDDDLIDARRFKTKSAKIETEIAAIDARLARAAAHSASSPVLAALDPGAAFLNAPVDVQRALVRQVIRVQIDPAPARGRNSRDQVRERLRISPRVPTSDSTADTCAGTA